MHRLLYRFTVGGDPDLLFGDGAGAVQRNPRHAHDAPLAARVERAQLRFKRIREDSQL